MFVIHKVRTKLSKKALYWYQNEKVVLYLYRNFHYKVVIKKEKTYNYGYFRG